MKLSPFAKAIAGAVTAGITAAAGIWSDNPVLIVAAAVAVPLSVYFTSNTDPKSFQDEVEEYVG